ncbi:MAG: cytochrome b6-f complex subunit 6 [Verrucomicrobia bacterium]|nr:cytochrome b6-f complex subunit 6 [Leptolyngbya sp. ES-bin-22]
MSFLLFPLLLGAVFVLAIGLFFTLRAVKLI